MGQVIFRGLMLALLGGVSAHADGLLFREYQGTITRSDFDTLLTNVYCPHGELGGYLTYASDSVTLFSTLDKTNVTASLCADRCHPAASDSGHSSHHA